MNDRPTDDYDLDELLHPARAFGHPSEVVDDPDLTLNEKRAILASWASDACAINPPRNCVLASAGRRCGSMTSWTHCAHWTGRRTATNTAEC